MDLVIIADIAVILVSILFIYWGIRKSWWLLVLLGIIGLFYEVINLISD